MTFSATQLFRSLWIFTVILHLISCVKLWIRYQDRFNTLAERFCSAFVFLNCQPKEAVHRFFALSNIFFSYITNAFVIIRNPLSVCIQHLKVLFHLKYLLSTARRHSSNTCICRNIRHFHLPVLCNPQRNLQSRF